MMELIKSKGIGLSDSLSTVMVFTETPMHDVNPATTVLRPLKSDNWNNNKQSQEPMIGC
jgi:hypothetical protein